LTVSRIDDPYTQKLLLMEFGHKHAAKARVRQWVNVHQMQKRGETVRFWGPQWGFVKYSGNGLVIVPSHSLSNNVGVNAKATFSGGGLEFMPKQMREWFFQKTRPMEFPLKHPRVMICDREYDKRYYDITYPNRIKGLMLRGFYFLKRKVYGIVFRKFVK